MEKLIIYCLISILSVSCNTNNKLYINFKDSNIVYTGRIDTINSEAAKLYWSGTTIKVNFEGQRIFARFDEERGDNYYNVIIDDSMFIWRPDTVNRYYLLADNLSKGKHKVEIFKRTEWDRGEARFYGFKIEGNAAVLPKDQPKGRKLEIYGNSITAGYAVEDVSGKDRADSIFTNNYLSYSNIVSRYFNADCHTICKSGIGITISWLPIIMPEMYERLNPIDSASKWDFSLYTPDVVIINQFQNDSWLVNRPQHEQFKKRFGDTAPTSEEIIEAYRDFVLSIRKEYPDTHIICALGNMDATKEGSAWPGYISQVVAELNDSRIYSVFVPYKQTPGHPSVKEQEEIAQHLIRFIENNIKW